VDENEIRTTLKQVIADDTGIQTESLADDTSFRKDLKLDDLSLLELGVDIDLKFGLEVPDEIWLEQDCLRDWIDLIQRISHERARPPDKKAQ